MELGASVSPPPPFSTALNKEETGKKQGRHGSVDAMGLWGTTGYRRYVLNSDRP